MAENLVARGRSVYRKTWQGLDVFLWTVAESYSNFHCQNRQRFVLRIYIDVGPCTGVRTAVPGI